MNRFIQDYRLVITTDTQTIEILPPIKIEFDGEKSINSFGLNRLNLKIYNLLENKRNQLVKDAEETKYIRVELFVGYKGNIKQVFRGNVHRAYPEKNGANIASVLECMDGLNDVRTSFTSAEASTKRQAVERILQDMPNTDIGTITNQNTIYRNKVIMGNCYEELKKLLQPDELMYIEDEKLYIIKNTESASNYISLINADTGLISTPKRENQRVEIETRMNPSLKIGGRAELNSIYAPYLNGEYIIEAITFKGTYDGEDWNMNIKMRQKA